MMSAKGERPPSRARRSKKLSRYGVIFLLGGTFLLNATCMLLVTKTWQSTQLTTMDALDDLILEEEMEFLSGSTTQELSSLKEPSNVFVHQEAGSNSVLRDHTTETKLLRGSTGSHGTVFMSVPAPNGGESSPVKHAVPLRSQNELDASTSNLSSTTFTSPLPRKYQELYDKLLQIPLIMSQKRLDETGRISCGGTGTVSFRTWQSIGVSTPELNQTLPRELPSLRADIHRKMGICDSADDGPCEPLQGWKPACAVVGNSGKLRHEIHGNEIDAADAVLRFNQGRTKGLPMK